MGSVQSDIFRRHTAERDLVICECQVEFSRLLFADCDVSVGHIVAPPFLLKAEVAGAVRRHTPDDLLPIDVGPLVEYSPDRAEE